MPTNPHLSPSERRLGLAAILAGCFGAGVGFGALNPLIALGLENQGVGRDLIGVNITLANLAIFIAGPFVPLIARKLGVIPSLLATGAIDIVILILYPSFPLYWVWCLLRFAGGLIGVLWWVVTETWLNLIANDANRSRVFALYGTALSTGFAIGPLAIAETGSRGFAPWFVVVTAVVISIIPIIMARRVAPILPHHQEVRPFLVVRRAPLLWVAAAAAGAADMTTTALVPLFGLSYGLSEADAALTLTAVTVGTVVLQLPIAWIADKWNRRGTLLACAGATTLGALLLPFAMGAGALAQWSLLMVWGGVMFSVYTVALGLLGERFRPIELTTANAAFILFYNIGSGTGPLAAGTLMEAWRPEGLVVVVAAAGLAVLIAGSFRRA
ncbi:MAG: MFS transporter [Alphaproteobacteria bacterium]|nr:MFS transporter [Alphaproteobacteria bacterium]